MSDKQVVTIFAFGWRKNSLRQWSETRDRQLSQRYCEKHGGRTSVVIIIFHNLNL